MSDKLEAPFEREERYIVIKRKHLDEITECAIRTGLNGYRVNTVDCVVVESDWPEYETVWKMIEDRVSGATPPSPHPIARVSEDTAGAEKGSATKGVYYPGCGLTCPYRDIISGRCERHGPTEADQIVDRVTAGFRRDLKSIMRSEK